MWALLWLVWACGTEPEAPSLDYTLEVPANFPPPKPVFKNNPVTKAGFELGRALFYDPILSRDNSISCEGCHKQFSGFADLGHKVSHGIEDKLGTRNSPALANLAWQPEFFWDGGVNHLEMVPLVPITNPVEMDAKLTTIIKKLNNHKRYPKQFRAVFGGDSINSQQLFRALSQFMGLLVSANSRYDKYVQNGGGSLTTAELNGLQVFKNKCGSCHATDLFTDFSYRNNGLDTDFRKDEGRFLITNNAADAGKFKVPSLRNVAVTSPYMHDGRFQNLKQVLNHYVNGVKTSATLDPLLQTNASPGIALTPEEQSDIIAFLQTLTDQEFLTNAKFSQHQ